METETNQLSPEESLDLITSMIRQAKCNMRENSFYFLLWGWVVVIASLGMYTLIQLNYERPWLVWTISIPAWIWTIYNGIRQGKRGMTATHFDHIAAAMWFSYGIVIFTLVFFGYKINFQLMPAILLVTAIPTTVSGFILKTRVLILGGITFWISGILCFLVGNELQWLIGAAAIIIGYLIPGYNLRKRIQQ